MAGYNLRGVRQKISADYFSVLIIGDLIDRGEVTTTIRNYEALYIIDSNLTDEQIDSIVSKYSTLVTDQGGEVQAAGKWDRRRLAYEIKGRREGIYILMYFTGDTAVAEELDRVFRISDDCVRHIIVRVEPGQVDTFRIEQPQVEAAPAPVVESAPETQAVAAEEVPAEAPVEEAAVETAEVPAEETAPEVVEAPGEEAAPAAEEQAGEASEETA